MRQNIDKIIDYINNGKGLSIHSQDEPEYHFLNLSKDLWASEFHHDNKILKIFDTTVAQDMKNNGMIEATAEYDFTPIHEFETSDFEQNLIDQGESWSHSYFQYETLQQSRTVSRNGCY